MGRRRPASLKAYTQSTYLTSNLLGVCLPPMLKSVEAYGSWRTVPSLRHPRVMSVQSPRSYRFGAIGYSDKDRTAVTYDTATGSHIFIAALSYPWFPK